MRPARLALLLLALAAARGTPAAAQPAGVHVDDFGGAVRPYDYAATIPLRRGVTSHVIIVKDLIDLVPFGLVKLSVPGLSGLTNGHTAAGKGFLAMDITLGSGTTIGAEPTLNVGLSDAFHFVVVHRGEITGFTRTPDPATLRAGQTWVAGFDGIDLGGMEIDPLLLQCHVVNYVTRTSTRVEATLARNATCPTTTHQLTLRGGGTADPPSFTRANGQPINVSFSYLPPAPGPLVGQVCASAPNIGKAQIRTPGNGQALVFATDTPSPVRVTIRWDSLAGGIPAPNNEWVITRRLSRGTSISFFAGDTIVVKGLQATLSFALPDTTEILVRARNCDQPAPNGSAVFSLLRQ